MLERQTVGQNNNKVWKRQHSLRITASNFGAICTATERKDLHKLASHLVSPKPFWSPATQHGIKYEAVAVKAFEQELKVDTAECGLFVCEAKPWLAASPDRIVSDTTILEVKCPFSSRDKLITCETVPYLQSVDGSLQLKPDHPYYYQVQGQLLCTARHSCYFCVYTLKDMQVIQIQRDDHFIEQMIDKLDTFFTDYFRTAVLERHLYRHYGSYDW